jgi:thioredoxin
LGTQLETKTLPLLTSADFDKEVIRSQTPAVVDFYADWCGPCRLVSPIIEQLSNEYAGKVKFAKLNTDENPDIAMKYGIMSIPTIMVFKNGQVASTVIGAGPASMYKQKIDAVLKG